MTKSLTLAAAALALLASATVATPEADACGYYTASLPVFRIATHGFDDNPRSFVLTSAANRTGVAFTRLVDMSYDTTSVAVLETPSTPWNVTLVGAHGTAQATASRHVALSGDYLFAHGRQVEGFELDAPVSRDFALAITGTHKNVAWHPGRFGEKRTKVERTSFTAEVSYDRTLGHDVTKLTVDNQPAGTQNGVLFGVLEADGNTWLVFDDRGIERTMLAY